MIKNTKSKFLSRLRGYFSKVVILGARLTTGDWSPYFGQYESQKHNDLDSNCCWDFAGNEVLEDQLEYLMKTGQFADYEIQWFKDNGYIDEDGDFYLARRYIATISGVGRNGNDQAEFWRLTKAYGAIPNKLLPYTNNAEYFYKTKITDEMYKLGAEFKNRVKIESRELGSRFVGYSMSELKEALKETELQIGIPVPQDGRWNQSRVPKPNHEDSDHSVALYKVDEVADPAFPYFIYDQYEPKLKQLAHDYFIPLCTVATVRSNMLGPKLTVSVWSQVITLLRKMGLIN